MMILQFSLVHGCKYVMRINLGLHHLDFYRILLLAEVKCATYYLTVGVTCFNSTTEQYDAYSS
ncbi:hypothetical protein HanIR_Chr06g0285261 [Helianthus annuus]|nr:hypothetical protein HanIR_Chr06g0285261 [Helianthus annuus]